MEFNTIAVSDGVSMGTEGMRASLVSREVIADSIELVARGHSFDGLVLIVGCDKTIPAAAMALCRLDVPGLVMYSGTIAAGRLHGRDITLQEVFEAVGAHAAGTIDDAELAAVEASACPGAGACGGQFTANTMSTAMEFLGLSPAGANDIPATHADKAAAATQAGTARRRAWSMDDVRPRTIATRDAFENAIACVAASGGSTNAVLHLLAIAAEAGVPLDLADFDRISAAHPGARRHQAGRPVRRRRRPRRRRARACSRSASRSSACSTTAARPSTAAPSARSPRPRARPRARR